MTQDESVDTLTSEAREEAFVRVAQAIRSVPDFPAPGILFRDITPVLGDPACLRAATALHLDAIANHRDAIDVIIGIESRGFLFGMVLAQALGVGFVPVRKPGKLPAETIEQRYALEYGEDCLQIHADALKPGDRVLVVDDLLATGGTAAATCSLIQKIGATVTGCLFLIELSGLRGREKIQDHWVRAIIQYS